MTIRPFLAFAVALSFLAPLGRAADPADIPGRMKGFVDEGEIAGAVTVVGRRDGVIHTDAVGFLDPDARTPMPKNAIFRIASMTKPITAIAIMMLVDEGKLTVDDPVEKHLPEFKGQRLVAERANDKVTLKKPSRPITLRDLLTHTSGLPGSFPPELSDLYLKRNKTLAEVVPLLGKRPLDFEPGTKWAYCNPGIDTLGRIIEVASEMKYEEFLYKRLFHPLHMFETTFYPSENLRGRMAPTFARKDGKLVVAPDTLLAAPADAKYPVPAGGLYSTAADLGKLYRMMLNKGTAGNVRFLSEKSVNEMTRLQTGDLKAGFTPGMGFGLGWAVVKEPTGVTAMLSPGSYGHGGAFGTQAWIDPKQNLFVVLLIQRTGLPNADASKMRQVLQEAAVAALKK